MDREANGRATHCGKKMPYTAGKLEPEHQPLHSLERPKRVRGIRGHCGPTHYPWRHAPTANEANNVVSLVDV